MAHNAETYLVFVYGTLKRGQPNHHFLSEASSPGKATFVGTGETVNKYPLVVASSNNLPFLLSAPGKGENVEGEIYEVDGQQLAWLDEFESHPDFYRRELTDIYVQDGVVKNNEKLVTADSACRCWVYFLPKYQPKMLSLKMFKSYSSWSPHHGPYNYREETTSLEDT